MCNWLHDIETTHFVCFHGRLMWQYGLWRFLENYTKLDTYIFGQKSTHSKEVIVFFSIKVLPSCQKVKKSDLHSQFAIFHVNFFFILQYQFMSTFFINNIFWQLQFLETIYFRNDAQFLMTRHHVYLQNTIIFLDSVNFCRFRIHTPLETWQPILP